MKIHGTEQFPHLGSLTLAVLSNHRNPETLNRQCGRPWMPISGDGKLHLTHFYNRSIIMQTAVALFNSKNTPRMKHLHMFLTTIFPITKSGIIPSVFLIH